ncbi:UDP-N-acetylmuramate--L-alanine ligase [Calidifontibacter sp. DB0510]|uniref:UDP-N-acetylmuramate--L-alanine ligase n=1 Tax=Metallococcus carri TaxID=1656884 RepID=A0A967B0G3_9MICO|nr:UDP-N-acetylmuramate--L-alanine ligase [Metallococcus carri]NHN56033.1 UDP-N-acetylmuramate--L-alanine ligase [Metallococcus carri]NOP37510.1 UDP-N-acetylmuramate--L-alanine ligase [Calidifontibacter sp. DB2511S]
MAHGVNERFDFAAPLPDLTDLARVHLIAIGGSGMSGIARLLRARDLPVSGSDNVDLPVLAALADAGCQITLGYAAATAQALPEGTVVVISSAIREDNPELAAVRARGLPVLHRAQALGALLAGREGLAVAGANGKTTTSAMATVALRAVGADPSYAIGAEIAGLGANAGVGQGSAFVVEADESDGSFVVYRPRIAIVTSVKDDHLDFYGDSATLHAAYGAFVDTIAAGGLLVACADDPGSAALAAAARCRADLRVLTYGTTETADVRITDLRSSGWSGEGTLTDLTGTNHHLQLEVPGLHNLENAAGVVAALTAGLDLPAAEVVRGLVQFRGTSRRAQRVGEAAGIRVVDDYAHNPGKLQAMVATGRGLAGDGRLIVVFQPHLYSRTRDAAAGLAKALDGADLAVVLDIYGAREQPIDGVTADLVTDAMRTPGVRATGFDEAVEVVRREARAGDLVLTVGAGDITHLGPRILQALEESDST